MQDQGKVGVSDPEAEDNLTHWGINLITGISALWLGQKPYRRSSSAPNSRLSEPRPPWAALPLHAPKA